NCSPEKRKVLEELKNAAVSNNENGSIAVEIDIDEEIAEQEAQIKEMQEKLEKLKAKKEAKEAEKAEE
ncbi:MAG: hypothetical protein IKO56_09085, partial [Alphaproteobacteria bacterium]|nr:hypothetical protein [Alphaproteobacteria bacterium]